MGIEWGEDWKPPPPVYGPPCGVGVVNHKWKLTIEEGQVILVGCQECLEYVWGPVGGEDVFMEESLDVRIEWVPGCSNPGGWHGLTRCDCGGVWNIRLAGDTTSPAATDEA